MDEDDSESKDTSDDVDAVKSKINQVQRLRSDVEDLRKFISDQYAEDIGNNCRMQWWKEVFGICFHLRRIKLSAHRANLAVA